MPQLVLRFDGPATPPPRRPPRRQPAAVTCGQVITESTLVTNDLFDCPFDGLVIGAPNIDVDLNGHTIDGLNYLLTGRRRASRPASATSATPTSASTTAPSRSSARACS